MNKDQAMIEQLMKQREELMRLIGVLVEREGGEVRIPMEELLHDRVISRDEIGYTGVILLKAVRP